MSDQREQEKMTLVNKLKKSSAMQSLEMERVVGAQLRDLSWNVVHSCYYTDPKEGKLREIDVVGKQTWKRESSYGEQILLLHLVIECKSARGYHLLFAPTTQGIRAEFSPDLLPFEWVGWDSDDHRSRFIKEIKGIGLSQTQIVAVMNQFDAIAYPEGFMVVRPLCVKPPASPHRASAFRETNIGGEKDLDNSVLWRASQALSSAVLSFTERRFSTDFEPVRLSVTSTLTEDAVQSVLGELRGVVNRLALYHPIVVIDCMLWSAKSSGPEQIDWCRFEQLDVTGHRDWWFDVVSSKSFDRFVVELTKHYKERLVDMGNLPLNPLLRNLLKPTVR